MRELQRQIDSALYERLALSRNKGRVTELADKGQVVQQPQDVLQDPYILEFLGLNEETTYSETQLKARIIGNMQRFLLELGKGFSFVGRQVRNGSTHRLSMKATLRLIWCSTTACCNASSCLT